MSRGGGGLKRRNLAELLRLDLPLFTGLLLLSGLGLIVLYSASGEDMGQVKAQIIRLSLAFGVMLALAQVPPQAMCRWSPVLFGIAVILLIAVLITGHVGKGAQRWLNLGLFRFQPSEIMKIALPMMLAWFFSLRDLPPKLLSLSVAAVIMLVPVLLIAKQPDLGTALLVTSSGVFVLFLAGISWRLIIGLALAIAGGAPLAWSLLHDYQKQRVLTFIDPSSDPLGSGYHIIQSKIAIGSGGLYGKGWLNGTQSHLEFIPERHTDFIFSVFSEEFGLTGVVLLMCLYLFIIFRGLYIASAAQNSYNRLLAGSLSLAFFVYLFINTGMVSGLLPVVGVPLPLVSYGGTSVVTILAGFGILMSVHSHKKLLSI
ncbi:MAG: rod shape-determining protein RodA [Gammaproteobacteria bacterium]|nr:rod shape-determining protein RodA [Gammaproteobacteria bacterium]MBU1653285.1 rod shape-determining protein RodA [Gammaproteobacteria bacterium]MBU1961511.1 rod shape-determining protein RodA [Gammaproteobacteria bacterium]